MSHVINESSAPCEQSPPHHLADPPSRSWLESFVQSFFQEKNIKWMLIIGAAIVFGSSLMLVNKVWPEWSTTLKYLTIVGYSGVIFCAAELSRRRLKLPSTGIVLQALTLLLLPVCFLSLTWLSAGSAMQTTLQWVRHVGLMIPAIALLWIASRTILDHWLRGRQATFLISFCVLCIAGAMPPITSPIPAFAFLAACWFVLTAGIVKVNRHTFWMTEQHRLPRIFGFLPIVLLGIQFVVLVGAKSAAAVPSQWIGFAIVMLSATVLMTARSVADVFRQRTGDLMRPLPWSVVVPLFCGLVLMTIGLVLSLVGFTYVGSTTYAVIPTSIVAAILLGFVARDTGQREFVWAALIVTALAYQCSPTLFTDVVQWARTATAEAIHQQRVPISMYGLTYLPLLGVLAAVSRWLNTPQWLVFSRPIKHFVTTLSIALFGVAIFDLVTLQFVSPFLVATANAAGFLVYAILFRDRRYAIFATTAVVIACATAMPALQQMQYLHLSADYSSTLVAGLALLMTATPVLDRLVNRIPVASGDWISRRADGSDRTLIQLSGLTLAVSAGLHWICATTMAFEQPLNLPSILQLAFVITALVRYTFTAANYFSAASVWIFGGYATLRWVAGLDVAQETLVAHGTTSLIVVSLAAFAAAKALTSHRSVDSFASLRRSLGMPFGHLASDEDADMDRIPPSKTAAFVLPLFDLTTAAVSVLLASVHLPSVIIQHGSLIDTPIAPQVGLGWSTVAALIWMFALAWGKRNDAIGFIAAVCTPLVVSSALITAGSLSNVMNTLLVWAVTQGVMTIVCHWLVGRHRKLPVVATCLKVGEAWLVGLLAISCLSLDLPMRSLGAISLLTLIAVSRGRCDRQPACALAIASSIQLLWMAAWLGGCGGSLLSPLTMQVSSQAVPPVFLTACVSLCVFQKPHHRIDCDAAAQWATMLRISTIALILFAITSGRFTALSVTAMTTGFALLIATEMRSAFQTQQESRVWVACGLACVTALFLWSQAIFSLGIGVSQLGMIALAVACLTAAQLSQRDHRFVIFTRPMQVVGQCLPAIVACLAIIREVSGLESSLTALNSLSLMLAAGIYFHQSMALRRPWLSVNALVIANAGLFLMWDSLGWNSPELYFVPIGVSIFVFTELMKNELPSSARTPLHYVGLLTVLCAPLPEVLGGSWIHMLLLMFISVVMILTAIGLRTRSLIYAGSAFLLTDLLAMVIRSTIHNVDLLWICGVILGISVIALAAFCENHREKLLARIRMLSAELATWN